MALTFINGGAGSYQALSTDIVDNKISGASYVGASVYITDTQQWFRVNTDLTLAPLFFSTSGSTVVTTPNPVVDASFNGQIYISSSTVPYSGSNLSVTNKNGFVLKAHPMNIGVAWFWNRASGSLTSGYPLIAGQSEIFSGSDLSTLSYGVTNASSACLCWMKV